MTKTKTFEEMLPAITAEIQKRRKKWVLSSISYMDFDDVSQMLLVHINSKWSQWDQNLPLEGWLSGLIKNRMFNIIRDNYGIFAPPCNNCQFNMNGDGCSLNASGLKSSECKTYDNWSSKKRDAYNLKLASNLEAPGIKVSNDFVHSEFDIDKEEKIVHSYILRSLPEFKKVIYRYLVIEKKSINSFLSCSKKFIKENYLDRAKIESIYEEFKKSVKDYLNA